MVKVLKKLIAKKEFNSFVDILNSNLDLSDDEFVELLDKTIRPGLSKFTTSILDANPKLSKQNKKRINFLAHNAIEHKQLEVLKSLIKATSDIDGLLGNGCSLLHHAIDTEANFAWQIQQDPIPYISKYLLQNGANLHLKCEKGDTPLDIAKAYKYGAFLKMVDANLD